MSISPLPSHWYTAEAPEYAAEVSGFQTAYAHRPEIVVAARHAEDVRAAVEYAARHGLPVAVQNTGHGLSVPAEGGILISTARLDSIGIDPERGSARIGAGVLAGALTAAAAPHGLAPLTGSSPAVGVVGYLLGGGVGLMVRQYGYAADHVTSIDLVTAEGRMRTLTPGDPVFSAVLGSGGNFGVVTGLEIGLVPVTRIVGGQLGFGTELRREAVKTWAAWTRTVPPEVTSSLVMVRFPDLPVLPPHLRGEYVASIRIVSTASAEETERLVAPLRAIGEALTDDIREMPYEDSASVHRDPEDPHAYAATNALLSALDDDAIDALLDEVGDAGSTVIDFRHLGGAAGAASDRSVVEHRDATYVVRMIGDGNGAAEPAIFARLRETLAPWTVGRQLNFVYGAPDSAGPEQTAGGYSETTYRELVELKARIDPGNMFRFNRNIAPLE